MKVLTIIGARPQFVKASVISAAFEKFHTEHHLEIVEKIIHTGQHYDYEMSQIFFEELAIPSPDYHLGVGSGDHGVQTGKMLIGVEEILQKEQPDLVLVYGDTNSTLASALASVKLHIPLAHVESGLRSYNRNMPEEINRVVTDHLSTLLFAPTKQAVENLKNEGIVKGVHLLPDVMEEALWNGIETARKKSTVLERLALKREFCLATVHRAENTDAPEKLREIFTALNQLAQITNVIVPLHPRTKKMLQQLFPDFKPRAGLQLITPLSYIDMIRLESEACTILTDSGGIQKEAFWLGVPCITMRNETEWIETVTSGRNILTGANAGKILKAFSHFYQEDKKLKSSLRSIPQIQAGRQHVVEILKMSSDN